MSAVVSEKATSIYNHSILIPPDLPHDLARRITALQRVISAVTIKIRRVTIESTRISLEEPPNIRRIESIPQIIQSKLTVPLLAGKEMPDAISGSGLLRVKKVVKDGCALQVVAVPFQQVPGAIGQMRGRSAPVLIIIIATDKILHQSTGAVKVLRCQRAAALIFLD